MLLKKDGSFICKVFDGEDLHEFVNKVKNEFNIVKQFSPVASRKTSSEVYIIARLRQTS